jgi:diguanylate cyclase (GGDEF)-like protein
VTELKRDADILGRLGGEEFAVLLPETNVDAAHVAVERFRKRLEDHPISLPGDKMLMVTASFGIAEVGPGILSVEEWLAAADNPLYAAKRLGRNRSEIAG